jgi:hypothetical protein
MTKQSVVPPEIEALHPGDKIATLEAYGDGYYKIRTIATISKEHITLEGDTVNCKFDRLTGDEVWGSRRFRLISHAKKEKELINLINEATFILSVKQLERCKIALSQILEEAE